jgi:hypothetical protein
MLGTSPSTSKYRPRASTDVVRQFHETWIGECQPSEGLTFSIPVLCDAGVMVKLDATHARAFEQYLSKHAPTDADDDATPSIRLTSLHELLLGQCGWQPAELHDALPDDLVLRLHEEGTELRPSFAIPYGHGYAPPPTSLLGASEQTPASLAGAAYQALVWELPPGLALDTAESETTSWHYPPSAKFERLLRETRVPMGLLCNGEIIRLLACPPGQATGWISFHVPYMSTPAGRDMLSALCELLHADRVLGAMPDTPTTLQLLEQSRERQADVTNRLGEQALEALQILLEGFEAAGFRDGDDVLREAMRQDGNHVYEGLLTVVLRLIFALYAEDRALLPIEHPIYAAHLSVGGLHDDLATDADLYGDTMDQRFGAWPRLLMLFRALYFGVEYRDETSNLSMPPHRGKLFDPERYSFLEGWMPGGAAPTSPEDRAQTRVPSVSDGVVLRVLARLLFLDGQRLSYSALEEEQLGSVYESLMGYAIERRMEHSVCLAPSRVWVSPSDLLGRPRATRVRFLKDAGVDAGPAKRLADAVETLEDQHVAQDLQDQVLAKLREFSVAPKHKRAHDQHTTSEVAPDRLVIQPGEERRRTSSHYTPRTLTAPIVKRTLEPLLAAITARVAREQPDTPNPQPRAQDLLSLKICDPAMGSGAFLVEACRTMAAHLVAAWVREGTLEREIAESGDEEAHRKPERLALRIVAQRCLYGVDKNPLAVELGKLSLWLLTLSRGQTFTFLDHCLKAGDSLVGLSRAQILAMDWSPDLDNAVKPVTKPAKKTTAKKAAKKSTKKAAAPEAPDQLALFADQTKRAFAKATLLRQQLAELSISSDRDDIERRQHELHVRAEWELEKLRDVADILLSTWFFPFDTPDGLVPAFLFGNAKVTDKHRKDCLARVRDELNIWLMTAGEPKLPRGLEIRRALVRECIRPMHWEIEFPEVFSDERRDPLMEDGVGRAWVDAVIGNPPFMGGGQISGTLGEAYLSWLLGQFPYSHGNSDLSAYFFRRADWMLGAHGSLGLIATNTIGQGDTRTTGLQALALAGGTIYDATQDMKWPVKAANVSVSIVHVAKGIAASRLHCRLDGRLVAAISSQLRAAIERTDPVRLSSNRGRSFVGTKVYGNGFVLSPEERDELIEVDAKNAERIFPYIGGQELNTSPTQEHDRHVIDFGDMSLEDAGRWPDLLRIVQQKVKPERDKNKREARKKYWWKFGERATGLYLTARHLDRCLACSNVSKHSVFAFQPTDRVFAHTLIVFTLPAYAHFGLLQSRIHERWARLQGSSMRNDLRYTPSECFETFPFPDEPTLAATAPLEAIAKRLYKTRAQYMLTTNQGLTKTYNALTDPTDTSPGIQQLRALHEQLDHTVLDAYGLPNIPVPPYAGASTESLEQFEDAVLDFLFAKNALLVALEAEGRKAWVATPASSVAQAHPIRKTSDRNNHDMNVPKLEDVFKVSGVPTVTFVTPREYNKLLVGLRTPGRGVVVEGPSGIGKTTAVETALRDLGLDVVKLSARKKVDIDYIRSLPELGDVGVVLIDDFHRLTDTTKNDLADYLKTLADEEREGVKIIIIGINRAGERLIGSATDLVNRIDIIQFGSNPDHKIRELLTKGQAALGITMNVVDDIVNASQGSFYVAQLLAREVCLSTGILKGGHTSQIIEVSFEAIRAEVWDRFAEIYREPCRRFCQGSKMSPVGRAPYLHILKALASGTEWSLSLADLRRFGEVRASVNQVVEKGFLKTLIENDSGLNNLLYYDTKILSVEDPQFIFFIKHIQWTQFSREIGFLGIRFSKRYDFALSFAGADRDIAQALFEGLSEHDISVFYDRNEQHRIVAENVEEYLRPIYQSEASFVICLLSANYPKRIWTKFESDAFRQRFSDGDVIPVWFANEGPGAFDQSRDVGGFEVDRITPIEPQIRELVSLLVKKLSERRTNDA